MRLLLVPALWLSWSCAFAACPPAGQDRASLQALKAAGFAMADAASRNALAEGLLDCLGDPDPALRDGIAFEAFSAWMRAGAFDANELRKLRDGLYPRLDGDDVQGFRKPFAALVLSEVARSDRIAPWMTGEERAAMVERASVYLESVRDYRGYDDHSGWRHGVAHGADWSMQLALNPALDRAQLERLLAAVASQVMAADGHAYVFGEGERLARPVLYAAHRGLIDDAAWKVWFAALPSKLGPPQADYGDAAWLARRHDMVQFLQAAWVGADQSQDPAIAALEPAIAAALKAVP
ncbi:MAG: DUF2785 domain-containing protein [Thermomonas sp.]